VPATQNAQTSSTAWMNARRTPVEAKKRLVCRI